MKSQNITTHLVDGYTPLEHAILAQWLGVTPHQAAEGIDIFDYPEASSGENQESSATIRLRLDPRGEVSEFTVANAIARLVLQSIQHRLPQCGVCHTEGNIELTRQIDKVKNRDIVPLPQFLFEIDWAATAPGLSWPASYYATYLPGYHVYVVTESADSIDAFGYCDRAINHFHADTPMLEGARQVIVEDWREAREIGEQQLFEYFWTAGLVEASLACEWAAEVWPETIEEFRDVSN